MKCRMSLARTSNRDLGIHADYAIDRRELLNLLVEWSGHDDDYPSAVVLPAAELGRDVEIGAFSIIHANVRLGDRVKVVLIVNWELPRRSATERR